MTDQRIKLAEFVGWRWEEGSEYAVEPQWINDNEKRLIHKFNELPDPRNDANDCEALIRKLRECGYIVKVTWTDLPGVGEDSCLKLWKVGRAKDGPLSFFFQATGDYKLGVCDLAEKVIDDE